MEGIALVTFQAPPQNDASAEMWHMLIQALEAYAADDAVRVVVLTGAGHHAFAGDPAALRDAEQAAYDEAAGEAAVAVASFPKPVIARVRGDCIGNALLVAMSGDMVVAAEDSTFALPGAQWGATYPAAGIAAMVASIGPQHAKRMLFSGDRVVAREALRMGLVAMVVDDADLSDVVVDLARAIADNAPLAVAAAKRMVARPGDPALAGLVAQCRGSQDYAAGIEALQRGAPAAFHRQ